MANPEQAPGSWSAWASLEMAIREMQNVVGRLAATLDLEDDSSAFVWDQPTAQAADLLERALADLGALSARWVELKLRERHDLS